MRNYFKTILCALVAAVALWACREDKPEEPRKTNYLDGKTFVMEETEMPDEGFGTTKMSCEVSFSNPNFTWTMDTKATFPGTEQTAHSRMTIKGLYAYDNGVVVIKVTSGEKEVINTGEKHPLDDDDIKGATYSKITVNEQANTVTIMLDERERNTLVLRLKK